MAIADHIESEKNEATTKINEEYLPTAESSQFLLAPEEQEEAVNDTESHKREKKSSWNLNNNQMVCYLAFVCVENY